MLAFILLSALLQQHRTTVYDKPIDAIYNLRVEAEYSSSAGFCCQSVLRLLLVDRGNRSRSWEITTMPENFEHNYAVKRADNASVVIARTRPDYGFSEGSIKLFYDVRSKRLLKKIEFDPNEALKKAGREEARRVGIDPDLFDKIKNADLTAPELPTQLDYPLPQSTYKDFARLRPKRVRNGYDEQGTIIEEKIGPYQIAGNRVWFGKTFYDGEGTTGVGGIGYFDLRSKKFNFLRLLEVVDWSVSALLVEDQTIWAGLQSNPEGEVESGGLLQHTLNGSATRIYPIEDPIRSISRMGTALIIGTTNGIYVLSDQRLLRHRAEPAIDGRVILVTENL